MRANEPLSLTAKWDYGYIITKILGLTVELLHPESGATMRVHREKVVLTDPDSAWEEISPRPRRSRQQVKQAHVPQRRANSRVRRDSSAGSRVSTATRDSQRSKGATTKQQAANLVKPSALPPFSQHRSFKRPRCASEHCDSEPDTIAKRTRSQIQREKRSAESKLEQPETKRWKAEQVLLLQFVCSYFSSRQQQK